MNREQLEIKKAALESEKANQYIKDEERAEIDRKVEEYKNLLLSERNITYETNVAALESKIELLNELIQETQE